MLIFSGSLHCSAYWRTLSFNGTRVANDICGAEIVQETVGECYSNPTLVAEIVLSS